jgi:hypothetical protein
MKKGRLGTKDNLQIGEKKRLLDIDLVINFLQFGQSNCLEVMVLNTTNRIQDQIKGSDI